MYVEAEQLSEEVLEVHPGHADALDNQKAARRSLVSVFVLLYQQSKKSEKQARILSSLREGHSPRDRRAPTATTLTHSYYMAWRVKERGAKRGNLRWKKKGNLRGKNRARAYFQRPVTASDRC
jgi:hypothetical protein